MPAQTSSAQAEAPSKPKGRQKRWTGEDNRFLIDNWSEIGSVVLMAMHLDRSPSSIASQASRLRLPRRKESADNRAKWDDHGKRKLDAAIERHTRKDGRVEVHKVAEELDRTIDSIAAQLGLLYAPLEDINAAFAIPVDYRPPAETMIVRRAKDDIVPFKAPTKEGRSRNCMSCGNEFWSESFGHRRCSACKKKDHQYA